MDKHLLCKLEGLTDEVASRNPSIRKAETESPGKAGSESVSKLCVHLRGSASINEMEHDRGRHPISTVELHIHVHICEHAYTYVCVYINNKNSLSVKDVFTCCCFKL